jgi:hypothetical protein
MTLSKKALPLLACLSVAGCVELPQLPTGQSYPAVISTSTVAMALPSGQTKADPMITNALVDLIERKDRFHVDLANSQGTPIGEILAVGSPIGYELRNRFLNLGIPLGEALSRNSDPVFREKLVTMARWDSDGETRAAALVVLAGVHDPANYDVFNEALVHLDLAVRFGALEALVVWGHSDKALPLLKAASEKDTEPILRVYAAAGVARLGDPDGLARLRVFLEDPSWLVRAMAARYLGEFGSADDYRLLVSRIGRETGNDFVVAECCIGALKLFPKTGT